MTGILVSGSGLGFKLPKGLHWGYIGIYRDNGKIETTVLGSWFRGLSSGFGLWAWGSGLRRLDNRARIKAMDIPWVDQYYPC